jgi:hypothetical protein
VLAVNAVTLALLPALVLLATVALRLSFARGFRLALVAAVLVFCFAKRGAACEFPRHARAVRAPSARARRDRRRAALLAAVVAGLIMLRDTAVTWPWASFEPRV